MEGVILLTGIETKRCWDCGRTLPVGEFCGNRSMKDGLQTQCKACQKKYREDNRNRILLYQREYYEQHLELRHRQSKRYFNTLLGRLARVYGHINQRCNNPNTHNYYRYGGRGIKNKFMLDEFREYVISDLGITHIDQIEGLEIDRIDNDGDYEPGNIRFIIPKENMNNRGSNS